MKTLIATLVSATMALPASSWAIGPVAGNSGEVKDDVPAVVISMPMPDGHVVTEFVAAVPAEQEAALTDAVVRHSPDTTLLTVRDGGDPVLKAAAATGYLPRVKTFLTGRFADTPLARVARVPAAIKNKIGQEINRLNAFVATAPGKWALFATFAVAGSYGTMTWIASSRMEAGVAVFGSYLMWAGFQMMFEHHWERVLNGGGELVKRAAKVWVYGGQAMTEAQARIFASTGSLFAVVVPANFVIASWVLNWAGHFESPLQALGLAIVGSNDILDKISSQLIERGKLRDERRLPTLMGRIFLGTAFEVASYMNAPGVQVGMTSLTLGALTWLLLGEDIQDSVVDHIKMVPVKVAAGWRSVAGGTRAGADRCRMALSGLLAPLRLKRGK